MDEQLKSFVQDITPKLQLCKTAQQVLELVNKYSFYHP